MSIEPQTSQTRYPVRATARTVLQTVVGLAVVIPIIVDELSLPRTATVIAVALAVSAVVTRIMAVPGVNSWLTATLGLGAEPARSQPFRRD